METTTQLLVAFVLFGEEKVLSMSDSIQFTCPECGKQMNLPADTAGKQGACPGCQKVVTIQPDPPPVLDLEPLLMPAQAPSAPVPLAPPVVEPQIVQPQIVQPGIVQPGIVQPGIVQPGIVSPAGAQKKRLIYIASGAGGLLVLALVLLLLIGAGGPSSPEALGQAVFNAVKANDKDALYSLGPNVSAIRSLAAQVLAVEEDEETRKGIEEETTVEEIERTVERWQDRIGEDFDDLGDVVDWKDASVVTVVSDHDPDNPTKDGPSGNKVITMCEYIFVVCEVKDDLYVLVVDGGILIEGSWYIEDNDLNVLRLSELQEYKSDELRDALKRTKDVNRGRILRELP